MNFETFKNKVLEALAQIGLDIKKKAEIPPGVEGQLYFNNQTGSNEVIPDYLVKNGLVVTNQEEYDASISSGVSLAEVFDKWDMFSHFNNEGMLNGFSPPNFPALTPEDSPDTRLTSEDFYSKSAWGYDTENDRIFLTKNYSPLTGLISPFKYTNYELGATLSSSDDDDDFIGLIIAFWVDPETGYEHTLSVFRALAGTDKQYFVAYNYSQTTELIISDSTNLAPKQNTGGWNINGETRLEVVRSGDVFNIKTSQFGSVAIDDSTEIILDLNSNPLFDKFKSGCNIGFSARSQEKAYLSNVDFSGLNDYIFWKKENDYDTYSYNNSTESFELEQPKITLIKDYIGVNRFVYNYITGGFYYINEKDQIIVLSVFNTNPENTFAHIDENQYGEHPAFTSQNELNTYLLSNLNSGSPTGEVWNDSESWDDNTNWTE